MNYIDTSTGYVLGQSLGWCGSAVKGRRSEIVFSTKSDWAQAPKADSVRRSVEKALKKAGLDYFDLYQIWGLQRMTVLEEALASGGMVEGLRNAQGEGLIKHGLGFTFHGDGPLFKAAVDSGEFLCATVSYNLLNRKEEALIDYAAAKGVGIIIMNPLAGGVLASDKERSLEFLKSGKGGPWYGALRFLLANKNITTSLLGLRSPAELEEDVQALEGPEALTETYRRELGQKTAEVKLMSADFCTGCGYCEDCPNGFNPSYYMQVARDFSISGLVLQW